MNDTYAIIRDAYEASGVMLSKTHLDYHEELIERVGLDAWRAGWQAAERAGRQNVCAYVARCAESAMLQARTRQGPAVAAAATLDARRAYYASDPSVEH